MLYFLPCRGSLEKADRDFQNELNVMHHFFGTSIFENMVVAATNHPRKQKHGFDEEDKRDTREIFYTALKLVTKDDNVFCPPIIYIAMSDTGRIFWQL